MHIKKPIKKRMMIVALAVILIVVLLAGSTISYLIRNRSRDNVFALGDVRLSLIEDEFPQDDQSKIMAPKSVIPKNPRIVNIGSTDEYVFLKVTVPLCNVKIVNEETNTPSSAKEYREIFNLISNDTDAKAVTKPSEFNVSDTGSFTHHTKWIFISAEEDNSAHTHTYLFGYSSLLTTQADSNETPTLFDKMQLRNILEGELPQGDVQTVDVSAYGIQAEELLNYIEVSDPKKVTKEELTAIFNLYQNQED